MIRTILAGALCVLTIHAADARPKHHRHHSAASQRLEAVSQRLAGCSDSVMRPCGGRLKIEPSYQRYDRTQEFVQIRENPVIKRMGKGLSRVMAERAGRVVAHPRGCPRRAFCGCGAAVRIFGKPIRSLWLARNWFRFPRASPAPGMVAVKRHHVFVLERRIKGKVWRVWDANSGGHRTRVHRRSIAGWTIVDPRGDA